MKQSWVIKFAPFRTSWTEIITSGSFTIRGVRSYEARNNLKSMKLGDLVFFYQSQKDQALVGLLEVTKESYPDPTSASDKWLTCNFKPLATFNPSIPLSCLRNEPLVKNTPLILRPRLSVFPIPSGTADWLLMQLESE